MVLVDTSVWIDLLAGRETEEVGILRDVSADQRVTTGDTMVCGVLQGIRPRVSSTWRPKCCSRSAQSR